MKDDLLWQLARTFGAISLVAIGGANATVPEMHRQIVTVLHWMDDATFADTFALAQAAPGPNVMVVSLIGWRLTGLSGLAVATLAMVVPSSLLALAAGRVVARAQGAAWLRAAQAGLVPLAIGLILASGLITARAADHDALGWVITAGAALFVLLTARNPILALAAGMLVAVLARHL